MKKIKSLPMALALLLLLAGCGTTGAILERAEERGAEAIAQRQATADKLLKYHVAGLCMANYDSLKRMLSVAQLEGVVALCGAATDGDEVLLQNLE